MKIAFVDLKRQVKLHRKIFLSKFTKILDQATFLDGPILEKFERDFARLCSKKYCVGLNSGTDALFFALLAYKIKPGDEVITVPNSYFSTAMVISNTGAIPVFVDADPVSGQINTSKIEAAITKKTKLIMPIHLYGHPSDMDPIIRIVKKYKLDIIEDCCQSHIAKYKGKILPVTETGAFSFYPGKNLGAFGDAGALVTDNKSIYEIALRLRNDGSVQKYEHTMFGYKSRLDNIQAVVLSAKMSHLDSWTQKRRKVADQYNKLLSHIKQVKTPVEMPYSYHVYHLYVIEAERRDELQIFLAKHNINTVIHYPTPIHLQKPYRQQGLHEGMFPITEKRARTILSLPMFPEIRKDEIAYVCQTINEFYAHP